MGNDLAYSWKVGREIIEAMAGGKGDIVDRLSHAFHFYVLKLRPPESCPEEIRHEVAFIEAEFLECESEGFAVEAERLQLLANNLIRLWRKLDLLHYERMVNDEVNDAVKAIRRRVNEAIDRFGDDSP